MSRVRALLGVARCFLTLPGTLHASSWDLIVSSAARVPLKSGECIRTDKDCGRLQFVQPDTLGTPFLLCAVPFFMNILLGLPLLTASTVNLFVMRDPALIEWIMLWVGWSMFSNAYPTMDSSLHLWRMCFRKETPLPLKLLLAAPCALFRAGAWLHGWWLTLPLAAGGAALLPMLLRSVLI